MEAYLATQKNAIWVDLNGRGCLELTDRDRLDLVHRMSTNDLRRLETGAAMPTVLTTATGRIIDMLVMINDGERALAITGRGRDEMVRSYLQRHVFFNDRLKIKDVSGGIDLIGVYGARAASALEKIVPGAAELPVHRFVTVNETIVLRMPPLAGDGFWLLGSPEKAQALRQNLEQAGVLLADESTLDLLRIEAGIPEVDHELTGDYIPLEAGLWDAVSFNKGCYTGQEIIARMESRGQLAKMLVHLSTASPLEPGADLLRDGKSAGTLTSIAAHPDGGYRALGFVKTASATVDAILHTADGSELAITAIAGSQPRIKQGA